MDSVFDMSDEIERANYLRLLMQSVGGTYICLWLYMPRPNYCLLPLDGYYQSENGEPLARNLWDGYRQDVFFLSNDYVPGLAFRNHSPYLELNEIELQGRARTDVQRQFYREARIKTAVFMSCRRGEIEIGWSRVPQNEMKNWFPEDFLRQSPLGESVDPSRPSSSSSSLRSLSMDSPESSPLLFNIPSTSAMQESRGQDQASSSRTVPTATSALQHAMQALQATPSTSNDPPLDHQRAAMQQPLQQAGTTTGQSLLSLPGTTTAQQQQQPAAMHALQLMPSTTSPHQQAMQAFALSRNLQIPTQEAEHAAITRAILAVLSSSPSSSSSSTQINTLQPCQQARQTASAFKTYSRAALAPIAPNRGGGLRKQSMLKRAFTFFRRMNTARREHMLANRPTSTQLHHMISERRRREKINESFQALRSLLPPETKKDKASVLTRTREYLLSLRAQVEELSRRNEQLEAQHLPAAGETAPKEDLPELAANQRLDVRIRPVPDSTSSEDRSIDLQVTVRGESLVSNMVIRILDFLRQVNNVTVISIEAGAHVAESGPFNRAILRLKIEGNEWDESAFLEAVRRVVANLAQ